MKPNEWTKGLESIDDKEFAQTYEKLKSINNEFKSGSLIHLQKTAPHYIFKNLLQKYNPRYLKN